VLRSALRPKPYRGDVVAAGVVVLATGTLVAELRLAETWAAGPRVALAAAGAALVLAMAVLAPRQDARRPYVTILALAGWVLALLTLVELAALLGAERPGGSGAVAWLGAALGALAGALAAARDLAALTAVGAVSATAAAVGLADWVLEPADRGQAARWVLAGAVLVLGVAAVGLRDRRRRHAVALADAAGLALLGVAATLGALAPLEVELAVAEPLPARAPWGWEALLLLGAWGLVAYASVDRERAPGVLGVGVAIAFAVVAARGDRGLAGWPLALLLLGAGAVAFGLRPARELPPEPGSDRSPAPPLPLDLPPR
jgi:hypothetical protein